MNKQQAINAGYVFTGAYSRDKNEMKERAGKIKQDGYLTVVVEEPKDKLSRGYGGRGYSVYAKPTEKKLQEKAAYQQMLVDKVISDTGKIQIALANKTKEELITMFVDAKGDGLFHWAVSQGIVESMPNKRFDYC
jgi:hypothetical protein